MERVRDIPRKVEWSARQRVLAYLIYLRKPAREFFPSLLLLLCVLMVGAGAFHWLFDSPLSLSEGFYATYCLLFAEHLYGFPSHWVLKLLYMALPVLGLVVILDGIVRFSYHLLRWEESRREWVSALVETMKDHVILCGLGRAGYRVLEELHKLGESVVVVEPASKSRWVEQARELGFPIFNQSIPNEAFLTELGLERAKAIILCTSNDLANLEAALDARRARKDIRVVLRLYDQDLADKVRENFGIGLVFSRSELAAPVFATSSADPSIQNAFYVGRRLLVVAEVKLVHGSQLEGKTLGELASEFRLHVLAHAHHGKSAFWPGPETTLREGDELTVQTEPATLQLIHRRNAPS